jgi:acetyl-CoA synthetase
MTYGSVYHAVNDLYEPESGWETLVNVGSREALNVAEEAIGYRSDSSDRAVRIVDFEDGSMEDYSFATLDSTANRVANFLTAHSSRGDRVAAMLPPRLEIFGALFGTVKSGRIYVPLSPLFGTDALNFRLADADVTVVFTTAEHARMIDTDWVSSLETTVVVDEAAPTGVEGVETTGFGTVDSNSSSFETVRTHPNDVYALKYTSGTTGQPKGVPTRHKRLVHGAAYIEHVVDLRPDDEYFVAASPAWSYGLGATIWSGAIGAGITTYRGSFQPKRFLEAVEDLEVTNLMVPPTALRQIRASDVDPATYDTPIRVFVTAGEALDVDAIEWTKEAFGAAPLDSYGQTEAGMLISNFSFPDWEIRPGSLGKPIPGVTVRLLDGDGTAVDQGETGEIAVRRDDISVDGVREYWGRPSDTVDAFSGVWYRTGDLAKEDEDGYFWYVGRADEVIISAGYRIGPEEVQQTLRRHDAVTEAGVIGIPDETRGTVVKAFVELADGVTGSEDLQADITGYAKSELSAHEYPRRLEFVDAIPKTSSGKIERQALKDLEGLS